VAADVTPVLADLLAHNRGPDPADPDKRQPPDYGVAATLAGNTLDIVLTFRRGSAYCCWEWGCHLGLTDGKRWDVLRQVLAARGAADPPRLTLRLTCVVEEGAVFFDLTRPDRARRGWYTFAPAAGHRYEAIAKEAAGTE
jgi:hypothetical protein